MKLKSPLPSFKEVSEETFSISEEEKNPKEKPYSISGYGIKSIL
jgi:hypothetical protein